MRRKRQSQWTRYCTRLVDVALSRASIVPVLVMDVGVVRVAVGNGIVRVLVRMRFSAIPREIVGVLVMDVVHMAVSMGDCLVLVHVLVTLAQMQPYADAHQDCRDLE